MTGTGGIGAGGIGTAKGGTGGGNFGTGGAGGSGVAQICNTLTAEYQSALSTAKLCQVGASGQCQQLFFAGSLDNFCSCPTYVTDSTALNTIASDWQAAGCTFATLPCAIACLAPALNTNCVSTDGGSIGYCSDLPGTGGTSGTGGVGASGGTSGADGSSVDGG